MCVILGKHKFFYGSVPKVACTSIKHMFFEFENNFPFKPYTINGRKMHIHNAAYKGLLREKYPDARIADFHRVTLVRDPVKRFLSAYANRVVFHKELSAKKSKAKLDALGLISDPDLGLFVEHLAEYTKAHYSIYHHTRPISDFLGQDAAYFSKIYPMEELSQFVSDASNHLGAELSIGHRQTGGPKISAADLTAGQISKIKDFYAADYVAFGASC
jgi:hypothetical protein